ncbi:MAG: nucleotidyltransferase family protein [Gammaproteobacteria bacterium]
MGNPTVQYSGLVLAAKRPGILDPLAKAAGVSHKCMITLNGKIMLERVVAALLDSNSCKHVYISIDQAEVLQQSARLSEWLVNGSVSTVAARDNLTDSVLAAAEHLPEEAWPLLITTADNALHTPEIIRDFVTGAEARATDVALGITREEVVTATLPDAVKAFHRVKDGGFSSCNLYALRNKQALKTVTVFRGGGQFGKRHWRILKAFGPLSFILYKFKLITIEGIVRRVGKGFGVSVAPVFLPYAYGPIDVDDQNSFEITEKLLKQREGA